MTFYDILSLKMFLNFDKNLYFVVRFSYCLIDKMVKHKIMNDFRRFMLLPIFVIYFHI